MRRQWTAGSTLELRDVGRLAPARGQMRRADVGSGHVAQHNRDANSNQAARMDSPCGKTVKAGPVTTKRISPGTGVCGRERDG